MARRLFILLVFLASTVVVSSSCMEARAQNPKTITATSVPDLNNILGLRTTGNRALVAGDTVRYVFDIDGPAATPYIEMTKEALVGTTASLDYTLYIQKGGAGMWRLDQIPSVDANGRKIFLPNQSNLWANRSNEFHISDGTLELMQGSSITLQGTPAQTRFVIEDNTTLNSRGSMAGGAGHAFIQAANISIGSNVSLGFDLASHSSNEPVLKLDGTVSGTASVNLNLLGFKNTDPNSRIVLLEYKYTGTAPGAGDLPNYAEPPIVVAHPGGGEFAITRTAGGGDYPNSTHYYTGSDPLLVRGESWKAVKDASRGRLQGTIVQYAPEAAAGGTVSIALEGFQSTVGLVTWTGADNSNWNATSNNWTGMLTGNHAFLHGDRVTFTEGGGLQQITVQAGGVQIGSNPGTSVNDTHPGMLINGGTYIFSNAGSSLIGIDGPGGVHITTLDTSLVKTQVTFASANSYWGNTVVDNGSNFTLGNSGGLGTGGLALKTRANMYLATNLGNDAVFNEISAEKGTKIYKDNTNVLTMEGRIEGLGDTIIRAGTLRKWIPQGILTVFDGATYATVDRNRKIGGLSDDTATNTGGTVDMGGYMLTIDVEEGKEYVFSGLVTGYGAVINKIGLGTQVFANARNTYTGSEYKVDETTTIIRGTIINEGTMVGRNLMTNDIGNYSPFGTGAIHIMEGALLQFDLQADPAEVPPRFVATMENMILGEGNLEVGDDDPTKLAPQILHLSATDSTYTGETIVKKGKLRLSSVNATGATSKVDLETADTALQFIDMNDTSFEQPYDRIVTGAGDVEVLSSLNLGGKTRVYLRGFNDTYPDEYSDYTGRTFVNSDSELHLLDAKATGTTSVVDLVDVDSDLYLDFDSKLDSDGKEIDQVYDRHITGVGNLIKDYEGTAALGLEDPAFPRPNNYTGLTTVRNGTLKLLYSEATGASMAAGGLQVVVNKDGILELAFQGTYNKDIEGQGVLAKSGTGTTSTLGGKSTYTGGTFIYSGTLSYNNLDPNQPGNLGTGGVSFLRGGGALQNRSVVDPFTQQILIYGGSTATFDTLADLTVSGTGGISHKDVNPSDPYYNSEDQKSHFIKIGDATMTIDTMAAWTGATTVKEGTLRHNIPTDTALTVEAPATYFTGSSNRQVSAILGEGTVETVLGFDFIVNNAETDVFEGTIIGDGNLVKINKGTLELKGYNTYTGTTLVQDGVLVGSIAAGTDLTVSGSAIYRSGGANREIGSLQGSGIVDMQNASLTINQIKTSFDPIFRGVIQNGWSLTKMGDGTQTFAGNNYYFRGDVELQGGFLRIGGVASLQTYFKTDSNLSVHRLGGLYLDQRGNVDIGGTFNLDGTLRVNLGNNLISAKDVTIGSEAVLDIRGIAGTAQSTVIIRSQNEIVGDFVPANVLVAGEASGVDFLEVGAGKSEDKKEIYVGQTLVWYKSQDAHGTFTLNNPDAEFSIDLPLNDVTGTFDPEVWDGKSLTKNGPGKLILTVENGYTGATNVNQGTLKLTHEKATAGSEKIVLSDSATLEIDFNSIDKNGNWTAGLKTPISGTGNLVKSGIDSIAVLGGTNSFTGQTYVNQGVLLLDGMSSSRTWVRADAGFGGKGTLNNSVSLEDGSYYYWRFDGTSKGSDMLTVNGSMFIGNDVVFRPVATVTEDKLKSFTGLTVVNTSGGVYGEFARIEPGTNPFYTYELDYSNPRSVRISGYLRDTPHAMSDIVATSLMSAQTRMHRTAYQQIAREWMAECPHSGHARTFGTRGQARTPQRTAWMNFVGRGEDFASSFFNRKYDFQSYGVQAGLSLVSNCTRSAGILYGREESKLSNHSDEVKGEDNYMGFYYGQVFSNGYDMKAYIGGGWQKNKLLRTSNDYRYTARYNGNTYNTNVEFGRRFLGQRNWIIRPFVGADLNITWIGRSMENSIDLPNSKEYRGYRRSDLSQFFFRAGIETTKSWRLIDFRAGTQIRWNVGDARPWTTIDYPGLEGSEMQSWVRGSGADLGRFEWGINVGMNWFLNERRNTMFFLDYDADVYFDRDGDPTTGTGTVGFVWRF